MGHLVRSRGGSKATRARARLRLVPLFLFALAALSGACGSSPPAAETAPPDAGPLQGIAASGVVTLPPGFKLPFSDLTVSSALGGAGVGSDGRFTVQEPPGGGPATVLLTDPNGKLVMLGHVDTDNPAFNDVSPTSTAQELLFLSTLSTLVATDQWPRVYELLAAAHETATVTGAVTTGIVANPTALGDQDKGIQAAVAAATTALLSAPKKPHVHVEGPRPMAHPESVTVTSGDPYGLTLRPSLDDEGVYLENTERIHRHYFVFRNGAVPSTGNPTDAPTPLPTWEAVGDGYLPAVTGVSGVVSSLIDYWSGKVAYAATRTPTITLPIQPGSAKANSYRVYVVGAGASETKPPPELVAAQPQLVPTLSAAALEMQNLELFRECVWPLLTKILPSSLGNMGTKTAYDAFTTYGAQFFKELGSLGLNYSVSLQKGDLNPATGDIIKFVTSNKQAKAAAFKVVQGLLLDLDPTLFYGGNFATTWAGIFSDLSVYLKLADTLLAIGDGLTVQAEVAHSNAYNAWDATATPPPVALNPKKANVVPGKTQKFQASVGGGLLNLGSLVYDFQAAKGTVAGVGTPGDKSSSNGHELHSLGATVVYTAPAIVQPGETDTLTLSVIFEPKGGAANNSYEIGRATATIRVTSVTVTPLEATLGFGKTQVLEVTVAGAPDLTGYTFHWLNTATGGDLTQVGGPGHGADFCAPAGSPGPIASVKAQYLSKSKVADDTITVEAYPPGQTCCVLKPAAPCTPGQAIGSGVATVGTVSPPTLSPTCTTLAPAAQATLTAGVTAQMDLTGFSFHWKSTATAGAINQMGGAKAGSDFCADTPSVNYTASGASLTRSDALSVEVWFGKNCTGLSLGILKAKVTVGPASATMQMDGVDMCPGGAVPILYATLLQPGVASSLKIVASCLSFGDGLSDGVFSATGPTDVRVGFVPPWMPASWPLSNIYMDCPGDSVTPMEPITPGPPTGSYTTTGQPGGRRVTGEYGCDTVFNVMGMPPEHHVLATTFDMPLDCADQ